MVRDVQPSKDMKRRSFLATALPATLTFPRKASANDRIRLGFIGLGGRARWLLKNETFPNAEIVALADCYLPQCMEAAKLLPNGDKLAKYQDYRRMLDREKLDGVFVETTTHARALISLHAMQAGLDVYAEKPMALTVEEGRMLVRAARHYRRILNTGTQQRSLPSNVYASKLVRTGAIGKIREVIVCNFEGPRNWTPQAGQPMPDGMDWDQWCNQTDLRPFHAELQRRWAWYADYDGGGQSWGVTGWGTHSLDQVQCALGTDDTGPVEIWPEAKPAEPNVPVPMTMRYGNGTLVKLHGARRDHADLGAIFVGDKGRIEIKRGSFTIEPWDLDQVLRCNAPPDTEEGPGENRFHIANFLEAMRTRKLPNADVEIGHRSTTVCILVNLARQFDRKLTWDPKAERFQGDAEANAALRRPRRKGYELPRIG